MEKSLHSRWLLSSFPCPPPFSHICSLPLGPVCCAPLDIFFSQLNTCFCGTYWISWQIFCFLYWPDQVCSAKKFIRWDRWTHRLCSSGLRISLSWSQDPNSGSGTPIGWLGIHILLWWRIVRCHTLSQKWEFGTGLPPQMSPMSTSAIFSKFSRLRA